MNELTVNPMLIIYIRLSEKQDSAQRWWFMSSIVWIFLFLLVSWTSADPLAYQRLFNGNFSEYEHEAIVLLNIALASTRPWSFRSAQSFFFFLFFFFEIFLGGFLGSFFFFSVDSSNMRFKEDRQINDNDEVLDIDVEICLSSRASFEEGKEILSQKNVMFSCISGKKFVYLFLRRSVSEKKKHIYLMPLPMLGPLDGKRSEKSRFFSWSEIKLWCC